MTSATSSPASAPMTTPPRDLSPPDAQTPVAKLGVAIMLGLLAIVLIVGITRNGPIQALKDLGFRSPAIALYTLLLLSPIFFEGLYPRLRRIENPRVHRVVENLHAHAPYLITIGIVMLVMRLENVFDLDITAALGLDWTPHIEAIEGDIVARFQAALRHPALDLFFRFIYVTVYALYHVVAMVGFAVAGKTGMVKRFTVTWTLVYAIALPFYILAPINETWTTNPEYGCYESLEGPYGSFATDTEGVLHDECGDESGIVYAISSINNCFPSLHNAFAWALPFLLFKSGWKRLGAFTSVIAFLVTVSTFYLGIHWVIDMVAGVLLAWIVTSIAVRFDYGLTPGLRFTHRRWVKRSPSL